MSPAVPIELLIQGVFIITMTAKKCLYKKSEKNVEKLLDYINISKSHALINWIKNLLNNMLKDHSMIKIMIILRIVTIITY